MSRDAQFFLKHPPEEWLWCPRGMTTKTAHAGYVHVPESLMRDVFGGGQEPTLAVSCITMEAAQQIREYLRELLEGTGGVTGGMEASMKRTSVESSTLKSVGYDEKKELLEVEFRNGDVYRYERVDVVTHLNLMGAESVGRYFHNRVSRSFPYEKVAPAGVTTEEGGPDGRDA